MDCKQFRKHHLAYLDDTLPGDSMAQAQHHIMVCDGCAAHDTLVRRSLMMARNLPTLEVSADFQERLRARLASCREERQSGQQSGQRSVTAASGSASTVSPSVLLRPSRAVMMMAASAMFGMMAWQWFAEEQVPELAMQPVIATRPAPLPASPYLTPAMMHAMATGNPVWPAAMLVEDAPAGFVNAEYRFAELR